MGYLADESVHLVVTSPPHGNWRRSAEAPRQLGQVEDYEDFVAQLARVWRECYRLLIPGGRLVVVVGDPLLSRRAHGRHLVVPLHADICVSCRRLGFDNLNPIIWHKASNTRADANRASMFLGKPYEPNAIVKSEFEFILMQRKPGSYRKPSAEQRVASKLGKREFNRWFRQFWTLAGEPAGNRQTRLPLELAQRLVRMFSFVGDTVLDPFCGAGTTLVAAIQSDRNSVGVESDRPAYRATARRLKHEVQDLFTEATIEFPNPTGSDRRAQTVAEASAATAVS